MRLGVHLGDGRLDRHIEIEQEPHDHKHPEAVLDAVHRRGERPFNHGHDPIPHLSRGVVPDHVDDGNADSRKDICLDSSRTTFVFYLPLAIVGVFIDFCGS